MKTKLAVAVMIILATYLGVYGQKYAYYLNDHFFDIGPLIYLTVQTVISIALYILSWMVAYQNGYGAGTDFWLDFSTFLSSSRNGRSRFAMVHPRNNIVVGVKKTLRNMEFVLIFLMLPIIIFAASISGF
ncbi:hypothetical protein [Sporosarcina sp. D27]|uniref:hypothetical protein n=1 Tax=Sporosarcina sp. D27 TaxID=1382305 RepID=UPI00046FDF62|nr:hypothetical protein [Sporosarcina sp. D27]